MVVALGVLALLIGIAVARWGPRSGPDAGHAADEATARVGGVVSVLGVVAVVAGVVMALWDRSAVESSKKELRQDATTFASLVVAGPVTCREVGSMNHGSGGTASCDGSPRSYAMNGQYTDSVGILAVKYVFSTAFSTNGEVTVNDPLNHRSLCVRVPDTDVLGAAAPETLRPPYDIFAKMDVSPFIADGACPDAPPPGY
ncbi:hypothetical protein [Catenulispora yoronensis]